MKAHLQEIVALLPETIRVDGDAETREVYVDGKFLDPRPSQAAYNHSPDGFNWGYGGSGPAQLALAILMKYLPKDLAVSHHQSFKFSVVSRFPQGKDFEELVPIRSIVRELFLAFE
jgi:hypothetical protein